MRGIVRITAVGALLALIAAVTGFVQTQAASAAGYPVSVCASMAVSTTVPHVGEAITISGKNFPADHSVTLRMVPYGITLAHVTTTNGGTFSVRVTMPEDAVGHQHIYSVGADASCPVDPIQLVVAAAGNSGGLPGNGGGQGHNGTGGVNTGGHTPFFTGVNVLLLLLAAAALIGIGAGATRAGRRKRTTV